MANGNWFSAALKTESIDQRYVSAGGFTHGFDYLRLILAAAVVLVHSFASSYGNGVDKIIWGSPVRMASAPILLMFFALSGFLVAGSVKRSPNLTGFLTLRALRLVPALAVEVVLSAIILGPLLTSIPLGDYFSHHEFFSYFANIYGHIHYHLPGVFVDTPAHAVNASLWTVPYELECYLVLSALWVSRLIRFRIAVLAITVLLALLYTVKYIYFPMPHLEFEHSPSRSLIVAFLAGVNISLFSDKIKLDWRIAAFMLIGMLATTLVHQTAFIAAFFAAYLVVYLGLSHPPKKSFLLKGDYSYGLYLFSFPIQQTYSQLFPDHRHWYFNFTFALIFGIIYAMFSWWCIEKPTLGKKKFFVSSAVTTVERLKKRIFPTSSGFKA
ncbi:acyltransferase [Xylophilus sp. GOD-11R]|uniref:acyltransferase family protein n=1 Tax=Xylophilus sp. GOD-11R TaxID=3089814 RepID=UPI00298D53D9|nr:acyltransferase [Xylophilus sp. GOD-11R]WPB58047.1 acyltransferase [Xylophilus sp. GOD-11R]